MQPELHEARTDVADLRRLGYQPVLRRTMGGFSSFALAFSLVSVTTRIFANFGFGLRKAGCAAT